MSQAIAIIYLSVIALGAGVVLVAPYLGLAIDSVSERITRKRQVAYRLANQCKGITKKGQQCLNWSDCSHHSN